jgi:hypothetical protein
MLFAGDYDATPSRRELDDLARQAGAQVLNEAPRQKDVEWILICGTASSQECIESLYAAHAQSPVYATWLLDCISSFSVRSLQPYLLVLIDDT